MEWNNDIIKFMTDMTHVRARANVMRVTRAEKLGQSQLTADPSDYEFTTEVAPVSEDNTMRVARRELEPHPYAKLIKASRNLLRLSSQAESLILERFGIIRAYTEEKAFLTGSGSAEPLGLFTVSNDGIPASRDKPFSNTQTAITADSLIQTKYELKVGHRNPSVWIFHREAIGQLATLKDTAGQYVLRMSLREGDPDILIGQPLLESEFAPNTFTTGLNVGLIGNLRYYHIVEQEASAIQRLDELFAVTDEIGFITRPTPGARRCRAE